MVGWDGLLHVTPCWAVWVSAASQQGNAAGQHRHRQERPSTTGALPDCCPAPLSAQQLLLLLLHSNMNSRQAQTPDSLRGTHAQTQLIRERPSRAGQGVPTCPTLLAPHIHQGATLATACTRACMCPDMLRRTRPTVNYCCSVRPSPKRCISTPFHPQPIRHINGCVPRAVHQAIC